MKRLLVITSLALGVGTVLATFHFVAQAQRPPLESVELATPAVNPAVITPDLQTFVTFTSTLADPNIKRPNLQFWDPAKSKWKTIGRLRDSGKSGDATPKDLTLTLRVVLLDSAGMTKISLPGNRKPKLKGEARSPIQIRIAATKKGQRGLVVSLPVSMPVLPPAPLTFGGGTLGPQLSVSIPATFNVVDASDPAHVVLEKGGSDGYELDISVQSKSANTSLEGWIFANAWGFIAPGDPSSFAEYPEAAAKSTQVAGLSGFDVVREAEGGTAHDVFLEDVQNQRVIWFAISAIGAKQDVNLVDNLQEALSIVQSLHL